MQEAQATDKSGAAGAGDAPRAGMLRFARADESRKPLLTDATELALVIGGLPDEAERTFTWQVNPQ